MCLLLLLLATNNTNVIELPYSCLRNEIQIMSQIAIYFLHSTSVLSFYVDVFLAHSMLSYDTEKWHQRKCLIYQNTTNLINLIAANRLVILLKFDSIFCYLKAISEFKLELKSGTAQFGQKLAFFVPCELEIWRMTLKTTRHLFYTTSRFVHHFTTIGEFKIE